jgi:hypothetical protein
VDGGGVTGVSEDNTVIQRNDPSGSGTVLFRQPGILGGNLNMGDQENNPDIRQETLQEVFFEMGYLDLEIMKKQDKNILQKYSRYNKGYREALQDVAHLINKLRRKNGDE